MNRDDFINSFKRATDTIDMEHHQDVINNTINYFENDRFRGETPLVIIMEELSELIKEVSKKYRGNESNIGILEETADVLICIKFIQLLCGISNEDLIKAINVKIDALNTKYNKEK